MPEAEALIFRHLLHTDATDSAFEQGWLLRTLHEQHGLALDALAPRFDRELPASVHALTRRGLLLSALDGRRADDSDHPHSATPP